MYNTDLKIKLVKFFLFSFIYKRFSVFKTELLRVAILVVMWRKDSKTVRLSKLVLNGFRK